MGTKQQSLVDKTILDAAQNLFLTQGFEHTEMMEIADHLGVSRSTLYRHFANKGKVLCALEKRALEDLCGGLEGITGTFATGYKEFEQYVCRMCQVLLSHPDFICFLRDFDCLYTEAYPDECVENNRQFFSKKHYLCPMLQSYERGIDDGSIRRSDDPLLDVMTILNASLALSQRILPRQKLFYEEQGYSDEMIKRQVHLLLQGIATPL
jgi:AcrR family transcriptional regulator